MQLADMCNDMQSVYAAGPMRPRQPKMEKKRQPLLAEQLWFDEERIEVRHSSAVYCITQQSFCLFLASVRYAAVPAHHFRGNQQPVFARASLLAAAAVVSCKVIWRCLKQTASNVSVTRIHSTTSTCYAK
jgi:hypothetical protein